MTWNTRQRQDLVLRGCIGSFTPQPLKIGLKRLTLSSAFKDSRFSPISLEELDQLHVSVSLLTDFTRVDWNDWTVGEHGVEIRWSIDQSRFSATYLPEVASSQGWDHYETLEFILFGFK